LSFPWESRKCEMPEEAERPAPAQTEDSFGSGEVGWKLIWGGEVDVSSFGSGR